MVIVGDRGRVKAIQIPIAEETEEGRTQNKTRSDLSLFHFCLSVDHSLSDVINCFPVAISH